MQLKNKVWKIFRQFVLLFLTLFMMTPVSIYAEEDKPVRVGWYEDAYNITGENGERSGYG